MGYIKDIANQPKLQTFPGALFEQSGDVPPAQCTDAILKGDHGITDGLIPPMTDVGAFTGYVLGGKQCFITSPPANAGTYAIIFSANDYIVLNPKAPAASNDNVYYITDGAELILTRNQASFAQYIHDAGYAYTIKGGKLYTNMPDPQLQKACVVIWSPLT